MSDPDRDWTPNGRPQSTMARNFSAALDDLFKIDSGLDTQIQNVEKKKQTVTQHSQELEALEAKLRETEERLKRVAAAPSGADIMSKKNSQRPIQQPVRAAPQYSTAEAQAGARGGNSEYVVVDRPRTGEARNTA